MKEYQVGKRGRGGNFGEEYQVVGNFIHFCFIYRASIEEAAAGAVNELQGGQLIIYSFSTIPWVGKVKLILANDRKAINNNNFTQKVVIIINREYNFFYPSQNKVSVV